MPEGHSVHRIAKQFHANFVGTQLEVTSPQGRFAEGAKQLDGQSMVDARAVGKQLFLRFSNDLWMRVHLGIYGAWDFTGEVRAHPDLLGGGLAEVGRAKYGQTGFGAGSGTADPILGQDLAEDSLASIGAPRNTRLRLAESERAVRLAAAEAFPPDPVGQVRVRLLNETVCADLRGPTVCEVQTPEQMRETLQRLGPDPANDASEKEAQRFITRAASKPTPIGLLLMDQSVIAGIGNVYRAEILFRLRINPHTPGRELSKIKLRKIWKDWCYLLAEGIRVGHMMTIDNMSEDDYVRALTDRNERHWVYKREGKACKRCRRPIRLEEFGGRKLYWCERCQK